MKKLKYEILFTILIMLVGMAAVTSNLVINGNSTISNNPDDFNVYFSNAKIDGVLDLSLVNSSTSLVFNKEFSVVDQSVTITYDVTNASTNYDADVNITCTQSTEYLTITNSFDTTNNLGARQTKTGTLTITQSKSYTGTDISQEISCTITALAVERTTQGSGEVVAPVEKIDLITFTIDGISYQAEEGMYWSEWVNSEYNTAGYQIFSNEYNFRVYKNGAGNAVNDNCSKDTLIIDGGVYNERYVGTPIIPL